MAYRFNPKERLDAGVRRIAGEQFEGIFADLENPTPSVDERIHASRKRCKRLRGLLRLVRQGGGSWVGGENAALRDAARLLSPARDAAIRASTLEQLAERKADDQRVDAATIDKFRRWLATRRETAADGADAESALVAFRERIEGVRDRVRHWRTEGDEARVVSRGFRRIYAAARAAHGQALTTANAEAFHDWRRRVKDHWCHLLLLEALWPTVMASHARRVDELAGLLGKANDWSVLIDALAAARAEGVEPAAVGKLTALGARRAARLHTQALALGGEFFEVKPRRLARPIRRLWRR